MTNIIGQSFGRIKRWMNKNHPKGLSSLNGPATKSELARLKKYFPDSPESYLKFLSKHNGEHIAEHTDDCILPYGSQFYSISYLIDEWKQLSNIFKENEITNLPTKSYLSASWFHPRWISIAGDQIDPGSNILYFIDLEPGGGGCVGQIIYRSEDETKQLAKSFADDVPLRNAQC
ncbi:SMI1/KNR4 family protein [Spartinivicinus poritis]|uniref:SMI1/KNR4 family protein n=1 Tax=Spartinivicinus poritis TaxID=2994640 RepID=A0ABT5UCG4_9GAMM|nr:SMI1/KNR4 family protein [Spartinivicinus sp. A2-2]MDE1464012.1 SMI1/KNR4 family protein [Spartinivicinus sp. A2-2]